MEAGFISWINNNWLAVLGVIVGVWVPYALRPPSARIRYWTAGDYFGGTEHTELYVRNISDHTITADQWRSPLTVKCKEEIEEVAVSGVSHPDIWASIHAVGGDQRRVILNIARLDPGDEISFAIWHKKTWLLAPELSGEIRGAPDPLAPALTMSQKFFIPPMLAINLAVLYLTLVTIPWMVELRPNDSGIIRGAVFILASPLPSIIAAPFMGRGMRRVHPLRTGCLFLTAGITSVVAGVAGILIAWSSGYRLWYPQLAIYLVLAVLLARFITRMPFSALTLVMVREEWDGSPSLSQVLGGLSSLAFAACVALGERPGVEIWAGMAAATAWALAGLGPRSATRLAAILGNPSGHLATPPVNRSLRPEVSRQPGPPGAPRGAAPRNAPPVIYGNGGGRHARRELPDGQGPAWQAPPPGGTDAGWHDR